MSTWVYGLAVSFFIYKIVSLLEGFWDTLYVFVLAPLFGRTIKDLVTFSAGQWAVVTGATDGIGKAYAILLAKKGFNIILISRNQDKLDATRSEIQEVNGNVEVKTVQFDFSVCDVKLYESTFKSLFDSHKIGILVNNVGISYQYPEQLHKIRGGLKSIEENVIINTLPVSLMSALVLPQMCLRNKGIIINVSSASGDIPTPYLGVYSAAKKYVQFLTRTCMEEYKKQGITFQCVSPYFVATKLSKMRPSLFCPSAESYVKSALGTVSLQTFTYGCVPHSLQGAVTKMLSPNLVVRALSFMMKNLRDKALRKQSKSQ